VRVLYWLAVLFLCLSVIGRVSALRMVQRTFRTDDQVVLRAACPTRKEGWASAAHLQDGCLSHRAACPSRKDDLASAAHSIM